MTALVLSQGQYKIDHDNDPDTPPVADPNGGSENGRYEYQQDPISGAFERVWLPEPSTAPSPPSVNTDPSSGPMSGRRIECSARSIMEGGIRVTATTERYSSRGTMATEDYINFEFGPGDVVTRRDRITDIRDSKGNLIWIEEESTGRPTIFEVTGVSPVTDPWGNHIKNFALLQRAQNQGQLWSELSL